ncbi:hypothetical protein TRV_00638 [Trichophyton verrucosum HKI 0517]|uniref:Uncharacterized protein n=1 Tax=Trichophyton verrucosum (strain HKI 0517) TaxID=663202 RepID=D4D0P3_TRIVH|nr:uncharacterized protein TRV_00638 [Trichophyton verrucosum HKI 0517]EFE44572.1 hypothetical protein TRV_00638 [Trichophyton verrucosum HKI 0517]
MACWKNRSCKEGDLLRPASRDSAKILDYSYNTWHQLLWSAEAKAQLPDACSSIRALLHSTPAIPDTSKISEFAEDHSLFLEGYSIWSINSTSPCSLTTETKKARPQTIRIGVLKPTFCSLSENFLPEWPGFEALPDASGSNFLSVFVLGWSYVLSTRLIELRGNQHDQAQYTNNIAIMANRSGGLNLNTGYELPIGDATAQESRWWAAILSNGCGWLATLTRQDKEYYAPWSCHLKDGGKPFTIIHDKSELIISSERDPPSSAQAQSYLLRVAEMHDIFDQLLAAFTAVLTIPYHMRFGAPVNLPEPHLHTRPKKQSTIGYKQKIPTFDELPYFMSFSTIPNVISSCLFSCFWEVGIPCNLASEWLHTPLSDILPALILERKHRSIIQMLATRSPNVAPLLLGSAITGMLHRIPEVYKSFIPPICLEAAVWSSSQQSFMDPVFHHMPKLRRNIAFKKLITREDEFRILYTTDFESADYPALPLSPYPPFGHWVWQGQDSGEVRCLDDYGFTLSGNISSFPAHGKTGCTISQLVNRALLSVTRKLSTCWTDFIPGPQRTSNGDINERLSEVATRNLFSWTLFSDGVRKEDKELWHHEWLEFLLGVDDNASETDSNLTSINGQSKSAISSWLQTVFMSHAIQDL